MHNNQINYVLVILFMQLRYVSIIEVQSIL